MLSDLRRLLIAFLVVAGIGSSVASAAKIVLVLDADLDTKPPGCIRGEADFTQDAKGRREFSLEVAGFPPGAEVRVSVAEVVLGRMEINTCGVGKLDLADAPELGEAAFPENFPAITGGETVKVGPLKGILESDEPDSETTVLDADLFAASPSCLRGEADLEQDAEGKEFSVEVAGFEPERSLAVRVAGVLVGTIVTDACGVGELEFTENPEDEDEVPFPDNFPVPTGGEPVKVGPLKGKLESDDD
jgi:hypothetical protein